MIKKWFIITILLIYSFMDVNSISKADEANVHDRIMIGLKIFPALVGGNMDLSTYVNNDGKLLLLIAHTNLSSAERVAAFLRSTVNNIYKYPIDIIATNDIDFKEYQVLRLPVFFSPSNFLQRIVKKLLPTESKTKLLYFHLL
ncbi:MAG: hypothetical protein HQK76_14795 [Desulfobacterales bacterium]|nr:hypothetical protein [Desulfobacterales bacterium]